MGTRLLDGRCLVTILFINRLVRFLPLELGRCLVTFRSLERLVTLFGAASSFGHQPSLTVRLSVSMKIGCCLVMFALCTVGSRLSMWRWVPIWSCFSL